MLVEELPDPPVGTHDVLVDVVGAGLNRADLPQRRGRYNLPTDATDISGMQVSARSPRSAATSPG